MYSTLSLCKIKLTFENLRGNNTICQYNETFVKGFYHAMHKLLTILVDRKKKILKRGLDRATLHFQEVKCGSEVF